MANGLEQWSPHHTHVQGGLPEGNFLNAKFALLSAGPPFFSQLSADAQAGSNLGNQLVYPLGIVQNLALSQNKAISRIFEVGSSRSYFISGHAVGQLSLGRVLYHGPSLLRVLYAYYGTEGNPQAGTVGIQKLFESAATNLGPLGLDGNVDNSALMPIHIPPGYDNMFINLASDLFSQPIGLMLLLKDNNEQNYGAVYFENAHVPQHSMAFDSQGLIIQESVGIQYERALPIKLSQIELVNNLRPDATGGYLTNTTA